MHHISITLPQFNATLTGEQMLDHLNNYEELGTAPCSIIDLPWSQVVCEVASHPKSGVWTTDLDTLACWLSSASYHLHDHMLVTRHEANVAAWREFYAMDHQAHVQAWEWNTDIPF